MSYSLQCPPGHVEVVSHKEVHCSKSYGVLQYLACVHMCSCWQLSELESVLVTSVSIVDLTGQTSVEGAVVDTHSIFSDNNFNRPKGFL